MARILAKTTCRVKESISARVVTSHRMPLPQVGGVYRLGVQGSPWHRSYRSGQMNWRFLPGNPGVVISVTLPQNRHEAGGDSDTSVSAAPALVSEPLVKVTGN